MLTPLGFRFAAPEWLWLLPALVVVAALRAWWLRRQTPVTVTFSATGDLATLPRSLWVRLRWLPAVLRFVALALLVVALARPQFGFSRERIQTLGVDIILAVDVSDSMQASDFQPNRLAVAKENMIEFVEGRPGDNFAIVGFGTVAALLCPLTPEFDVIAQFIDRLTFQVLGEATALGDAIALATRQFERSDAKSKVLVLLTDGEATAGRFDPIEAAEIAATLGVRIYPIGIGTEDRRSSWFQMTMAADFNPEVLRQIAAMTGGQYFHASNSTRFEEIFREIDQLERTRRERSVNREFDEKMAWFVWPALALLLLEALLARTRLRVMP